jgi:hypothetical protein
MKVDRFSIMYDYNGSSPLVFTYPSEKISNDFDFNFKSDKYKDFYISKTSNFTAEDIFGQYNKMVKFCNPLISSTNELMGIFCVSYQVENIYKIVHPNIEHFDVPIV